MFYKDSQDGEEQARVPHGTIALSAVRLANGPSPDILDLLLQTKQYRLKFDSDLDWCVATAHAWLLLVACCVLRVACCLLLVACCLLGSRCYNVGLAVGNGSAPSAVK